MAEVNREAVLTRLPQFACATDRFNHGDNPYAFQPNSDREPIAEMARGNYGINGAPIIIGPIQNLQPNPRFDGLQLVIEEEPRRFKLIGTGIAGINHAFRLSEFENGQSTLVAVEELRAGIHGLDPRGVWALGQIGAASLGARRVQ